MQKIHLFQTLPQSKFLSSPNTQNNQQFDKEIHFFATKQTITSEENSHMSQNYHIIILILCILILICVCGLIFEVQRRKKLRKETEQKLLQQNQCSIWNNKIKINQIYNSIQNSCWILKRINIQKCITKQLKFKIIQENHNNLELQINQESQQEPWAAEGNILISPNQNILIHLRTSIDSDLLKKKDSTDCIYLLQQYDGTYIEQENKFQGLWKVYGSQGLNNQHFFGSFELQKQSL